jgi:hypothetical protein
VISTATLPTEWLLTLAGAVNALMTTATPSKPENQSLFAHFIETSPSVEVKGGERGGLQFVQESVNGMSESGILVSGVPGT